MSCKMVAVSLNCSSGSVSILGWHSLSPALVIWKAVVGSFSISYRKTPIFRMSPSLSEWAGSMSMFFATTVPLS